MRYLLVGFMLVFNLTTVHAQERIDCLQTLARANEEFNAGHFFGIPTFLKECLDKGFTNEQRVQAYHLLTQAYLILDDPIAAEDSYLKLLKADPEYIATPDKDPIDLVYLSKKFTTTPIFTPHFRVGGNIAMVRTIYEINSEGYDVSRRNSLKPGYHFGAGIDWNINDNLSVGGEIDFSFKSFKATRSGISLDDVQEATERQTWFDIPFYIKYRHNLGKIRPYGYAGFAINMLLSARVELRTENLSPTLSETGSRVTTEGPDVNIRFQRNFINRSLVAGGGAYYKIGQDFLFADLRYMMGLSNLTDVDQNYSDDSGNFSPNIARYRWVGDYFRLDNLSIAIGYVRPIYDPRKIKKARTNKVLRDINKN